MSQLQVSLLKAVLLSMLSALSVCQEEFEVINTGRFGTDENSIELECRSNLTTSAVPRARFWLNEASRSNALQALGIDVRERPNNRIIIIISQEFEGTYFCGRDLEHFGPSGTPLIAHPNPFLEPREERIFFAKVGTTATLGCSLLPGALLRQYFTDWTNVNNSNDIVARIDGPRPTFSPRTTPSSRFSVNEETFSLMIDSVGLSDDGLYRCVMGVSDPEGRQMVYQQTVELDLRLIVYQAPIITQEPEDEIITLSDNNPNQNVEFHCTTRGDPQPEIVWVHRSREIEFSDDKYSIFTKAQRTGPGDYIVSSYLTILNVEAIDAGDVVCRVMAEDDNLPTTLQTEESVAQLAVIGSFSDLTLLIGQNRDIIFKLMLPAPILVPVQLYIVYEDANNPNRVSQPRVTNNTYSNTRLITHLEPSFRVPENFNSVRIRIRLQFENLQGPFNTSDTFNIQRPNVVTAEQAKVQQTLMISIASSVTAFGVLVAILVTIITCVYCRLKVEKSKGEHDEVTKENRQASLAETRINREAETAQLREHNKFKLAELKEKQNHERNMKVLEIHADKMSSVGKEWKIIYLDKNRGVQVSIEKTPICSGRNTPCFTETESGSCTDSGNDSIDGPVPSHAVYHAHSLCSRRPVLRRDNSVDVESQDSRLEKVIMEDCVQTIMKASLNDAVLGPTLRRMVSNDNQLS